MFKYFLDCQQSRSWNEQTKNFEVIYLYIFQAPVTTLCIKGSSLETFKTNVPKYFTK